MNKSKAAMKRAKWLFYCLKIGWDKNLLPELEKAWDSYYDENGNVKPDTTALQPKESIIVEQIAGYIHEIDSLTITNRELGEKIKELQQGNISDAVEFAEWIAMYDWYFYSGTNKEQKKLSACKTKEDLNDLFKGRQIMITDKDFWHDHLVDFIEMVGEGERVNWRMKVKTKYGNFLELKPNQVMIITQTVTTTKKEADKIHTHLKSQQSKL